VQQEKIKFEITGMTCGGCASKITSSLQKDPRISSAVIDFATATGIVFGTAVETDVAKIVENLGYGYRSSSAQKVGANSIKDLSRIDKKRGLNPGWVAAFILAVPVMTLAMGPWHIESSALIQGVLTTLFLIGPASSFFIRAIKQITHGYVTMDVLVAVGMLSAWVLSWFMFFHGSEHLYFESAVMIGFFVLSGKALEDWARQKSIGDVDKLVKLRPQSAFKVVPSCAPIEVPVAELKIGDTIYLRPGDMLALDGLVIEGAVGFDESIISGESNPVVRGPGDEVPAGAINASAIGILLRVSKIGSDTTIERIIQMVEDARLSKPPIQKIADQVSRIFVPVVIFLSIGTTVWWLFIEGHAFYEAIMTGLSVLVVACPCALGLATPVAWVAGLGRAARSGILVRSYEALEVLKSANAVVFDKTGTLTYGKPQVFRVVNSLGVEIRKLDQATEEELFALRCGLSALAHSSHPHARALASWLKPQLQTLDLPATKLLKDVPGQGVECETTGIDRLKIKYGRLNFVTTSASAELISKLSIDNPTVAISVDGQAKIVFELSDALKEDAINSLKELLSRGKDVYIASGDKAGVVTRLLGALPLAPISSQYAKGTNQIKYKAEMTPVDKKQLVESLRQSGSVVAFFGDGINDAPALAVADIGIAVGSGADVAASNAGLVIQTNRAQTFLDAIELSARITRIIKENFFWAFFYNIAAIPVAMLGLLNPMWASAAMAMSSLSVVLNALRLRR